MASAVEHASARVGGHAAVGITSKSELVGLSTGKVGYKVAGMMSRSATFAT